MEPTIPPHLLNYNLYIYILSSRAFPSIIAVFIPKMTPIYPKMWNLASKLGQNGRFGSHLRRNSPEKCPPSGARGLNPLLPIEWQGGFIDEWPVIMHWPFLPSPDKASFGPLISPSPVY